jgi:hypothetical protein
VVVVAVVVLVEVIVADLIVDVVAFIVEVIVADLIVDVVEVLVVDTVLITKKLIAEEDFCLKI